MVLVNRVATGLGVQPEILTTTPEGRQVLTSLRLRTAIESDPTPDGKGGLGYLPSVNEITDAFRASATLDEFEHRFETSPEDAILYLTAPDFDPSSGRYSLRPGALQFINTLPATLERLGEVQFQNGAKVNLFQHAARPFLARAADELYDAARAENLTPEDKAARIQAARYFERSFLGSDRMARAAQEPDDVRQARERLQAEEQRRVAERQAQANQMGEYFHNAVIGRAAERLESFVDRILAETGTTQNIPDYALPALRDQIIEEAVNLTSGNPELNLQPKSPIQYQHWSTILAKWTAAARFRALPDGVTTVSDAYFRLAIPNVRAAARRILGQQVSAAAQSNATAHAQARNGAARIEPGATPGTAPPQSVMPPTAARGENESQADYGARLIRDKINLARAQNQPIRR